jgi:NADH:ubiquinone oxidoreductase subunit 6 (subunit J)
MNLKHLPTKKYTLNSFFSSNRIVKITILLIGHLIGVIILTVLAVLLSEYIIGGLSAVIGTFFGSIWNNLKLNLLPPVIIGLSFVVLLVSNPIYALVSLILIFFNTALFLVGTHVEFLALIYIIIYIGAIAILFLFVIMMFNLKELQDSTTWSQNKDFLSISFTFYLFILSKFYYILLNLLLNYVEYDVYFNDILALRYELMFKRTWDWYNNFVYDISRALISETTHWNTTTINLTDSSNQLNTDSINIVPNHFIEAVYNWYMNKMDIMAPVNFGTYWNWNSGTQQKLSYSIDVFLTAYISPIDISIIGQVLYTYYSYLFLLATMILLIAMIGAIILALSTSEKKEVSQGLFKPNFRNLTIMLLLSGKEPNINPSSSTRTSSVITTTVQKPVNEVIQTTDSLISDPVFITGVAGGVVIGIVLLILYRKWTSSLYTERNNNNQIEETPTKESQKQKTLIEKSESSDEKTAKTGKEESAKAEEIVKVKQTPEAKQADTDFDVDL